MSTVRRALPGVIATILVAAGLLAGLLQAASPGRSAVRDAPSEPGVAQGARFGRFIRSLQAVAAAAGIPPALLDAAFRDMAPDPKVLVLATRQSEFSRPIGEYVEGAASAVRVSRGRDLRGRWSAVLDGIESRSGVPRDIVLALWAMESDFGSSTGGFSTVRSLATLAFRGGERAAYFRTELLDALRAMAMEARVGRTAHRVLGRRYGTDAVHAVELSWPSRLDGDGDGRRDIWGLGPGRPRVDRELHGTQRVEGGASLGGSRSCCPRA